MDQAGGLVAVVHEVDQKVLVDPHGQNAGTRQENIASHHSKATPALKRSPPETFKSLLIPRPDKIR